MKFTCDIAAAVSLALSCIPCAAQPQAPLTVHISGYVQDVSGAPVAGAVITAHGAKTVSDSAGHYVLNSSLGLTRLEVVVGQNTSFRLVIDLEEDRELNIRLKTGPSITVRAEPDARMLDPSTQGYTRDELVEAHPVMATTRSISR